MRHYAKITVVVLSIVGLAALIWTARSVLVLVIIGLILAAGLDPVIAAMHRRGVRRGWAVLILFVVLAAMIVLFVALGIVPAITQAASFVVAVPSLLASLAARFGDGDDPSTLVEWLLSPEAIRTVTGLINDIAYFLADSIGLVLGLVGGVLGMAFTGLTLASVTVYFMLAMPRLKAFGAKAMGDPERLDVFAEVIRRVGGYVTGQLGICTCAGVVSGVFFLIIDMPYPALLALLIAVLDAVPQVGATIGAVVSVAVALTQSIGMALAVAIFFIVYQQIENYVIAPRVFSSSVSLSPITAFLSILLGGTIGGFVGAVLALPVAATVKTIFRYVFRRELADIEGRDVPAEFVPPEAKARRKRRRAAAELTPAPGSAAAGD